MSGRRRHWLLDCAFLPAYERFRRPRVPRNGASTGAREKTARELCLESGSFPGQADIGSLFTDTLWTSYDLQLSAGA